MSYADILTRIYKGDKEDDDPYLTKTLTRLKNLKPLEVSYVKRGANRIPFLITKEDKVKFPGLEKLLKKELKNATKIAKVLEDGSLETADQDAIKAVLQILAGLRDQVSDETLGELMALAEIEIAPPQVEKDELLDDDGDDGEGAGVVETLKERVAKLEKQLMVGKEGDHTPDEVVQKEENALFSEEDEIVAKSLTDIPINKDGSLNEAAIPESVRGLVSGLYNQNKETKEALMAVTKSLEDERQVRITKSYEEKAAQFEGLGVENLAVVLKDIGTKSADSLDTVMAILKVANDSKANGSAGAFGEIGSSRGFTDDGSNPDFIYKNLEDRALAVYKDELDQGANRETLINKFMTGTVEGRGLYSKYLARLRNVRG